MDMLRKPNNAGDVRFAAGKTLDFLNPESHERTPGYRVLYSTDDEAGIWVGLCIDHGVYLEGESGESLGEIHSRFCDRILEMKRSGVIDNFEQADSVSVALWEEIRGLGAFASQLGDPDKVLMDAKAKQDSAPSVPATILVMERYYSAPSTELALAA